MGNDKMSKLRLLHDYHIQYINVCVHRWTGSSL